MKQLTKENQCYDLNECDNRKLKRLLNEKECAEYLSCSRSWLRQSRCYNWPDSPPYIRLGRRMGIRYDIYELDKWLEKNKVG